MALVQGHAELVRPASVARPAGPRLDLGPSGARAVAAPAPGTPRAPVPEGSHVAAVFRLVVGALGRGATIHAPPPLPEKRCNYTHRVKLFCLSARTRRGGGSTTWLLEAASVLIRGQCRPGALMGGVHATNGEGQGEAEGGNWRRFSREPVVYICRPGQQRRCRRMAASGQQPIRKP